MKYIFLLALALSSTMIFAAPTRDDLAVSLIPDSLLHNAHSVIRSSETTLEILSASSAVYTTHSVITVLDEAAANELSIIVGYDRFQKFKDMRVLLYDRMGKLMNKHSIYDMQEYAAFGGALFSDARVKHMQTGAGQYPVTIDLTVVREFDGLLDYPDWNIQANGQSLESSSFTVTTGTGQGILYKAYNTHVTPVITDHDRTYTWSVAGQKVHRVPPNSYSGKFYLPHVDISPSHFEIESYRGSMSSWGSFGTTLSDMWRDKRNLPDDVQSEIKLMVKDAHTDREKALILYDYLQKNFRYVSVQVGIGGFIPFDAATVHTTRYGDCKALSNYMCALLTIVGIKAYPVLINSGSKEHAIDTTFPSNKFDHVVLYSEPDGKPMWFECTSNAMPGGQLGTFTENRYGLMLNGAASHILCTPPSSSAANEVSVSNEITQSADGASISTGLDLSGEFRGAARQLLVMGTEKEQISYIFNYLHIRQPEEAAISRPKDSVMHVVVFVKGIKDHAYDFKTGDKSFFASTLISKWYENVAADSAVKYDILIDFPAVKKEQLVYHLGAGNISLPSDFDLDNNVISFHRKAVKEPGNKVTIETELKTKSNIIHHGDIALLKESLQKVNKYLQQKVILEDKQ